MDIERPTEGSTGVGRGSGRRPAAWAAILVAVGLGGCATAAPDGDGWDGYAALMDNAAVVERGGVQAEGSVDMPAQEPVLASLVVRRGVGAGTELTAAVSDCRDPECGSVALGARWAVSEGRALMPALRLGGAVIGGELGILAFSSEVIAGWDLGAGFGLEGAGTIEAQSGELDGGFGLDVARSLGGRLEAYAGGARAWSGGMGAGAGVVVRPFPSFEVDLGVWTDVDGSGERGMSLVVARRW